MVVEAEKPPDRERSRLPDDGRIIHARVVEALTTNETQFFRDAHPFETLRKTILPELIQKRNATRTLNLWSAAASTGQEAYSLAMLLDDQFPELGSWTVRLLGSDIAERSLPRYAFAASQGRMVPTSEHTSSHL